MLGKTAYPTINKFTNALGGFDMRKDEEGSQQNHYMPFSTQRGREEETALKNEKIVTLILDRGRNFKSVGQ